jgi:2,3-diketo-5-methylthio-1-phosphopentane phosphatase
MISVRNKNFKIFVDFDGTVTQQDVGEEMFLKFGDADEAIKIVKEWMDGKITSSQSWILLCKTVIDFKIEKFDDFIDTIYLDPYFKDFVAYTEKNSFDLTILSDGLDYYIRKILKRENLEHLRFYSNKLTFGKEYNLIPSFPNGDEECIFCANCKRNQVVCNSGDDEISIYIGDGFSDTCAALYCDYIFAKRTLLKYCERNRISYYPFTTFKDVINRIDSLKQKKFIKKRYQAELKRKALYLQG